MRHLSIGLIFAAAVASFDAALICCPAGPSYASPPDVAKAALKRSASSALALPPQMSAYFGPDNALPSAGVNNYLTLPHGAMFVPPQASNSWFIFVAGQTSDNINEAAQSARETILANCGNPYCTNGGDRSLSIQPPAGTTPFAISLSAKRSGVSWWQAKSVASASISGAGSGYANGVYAWTATGGGCAREPSGTLTVGRSVSGAIGLVSVSDPGFACASTPTLSVSSIVGIGSGSGGAVTFTLGPQTGVTTTPGQKWCGVVGQWGGDAALNGYQYAVFVDDNGNPLAGSPAVSTASNASFFTTQAAVGDIFNTVGSAYPAPGAYANGYGGQLGPVAMVWGVYPVDANGAPSAAVLSQLCTGQLDIALWSQAQGYTVHSLYRLNDAGVWADTSGSGFPNATAVGEIGVGSPIDPPQALVLNDNGPYTTYPVSLGQSGPDATGTVTVSGTYSALLLGETPPAIQAQISSTPGGPPVAGCANCAWTTIASNLSGGVFSGSIAGVPQSGSGSYYVSVRTSDNPGYVYTGGPIRVGLVVGWIGQSQMAVLWNSVGSGDSLSVETETLAGVGPLNLNAPSYYANTPLDGAHVGLRPITPASAPGSAVNVVGDGILEFMKYLSAYSGGWPVEVVNFTRPGTPVDDWLYGSTPQSQALVASSPTTFVGPGAGGAISAGALPALPNAKVSPLLVQTILRGSLSIVSNGSIVATDDGHGNIVGVSVASGSINYLTQALTVTFVTAPAAAPLAQWTNIVDFDPGIGAANDASTYVGYDFFGTGPASSGAMSAIMARLPGGVSMMMLGQCAANESEFVGSYAAGAQSMTAKWSYVLETKFPSDFPQYAPQTPVLSLGYSRDVQPASSVGYQALGGCVRWSEDFGTAGSGYAGANVAYGGSYWDNAVQFASLSGDNPHETSGPYGAQRIGRRSACNAWAVQSDAPELCAEPTISSAVFDLTATYNPVCVTTPYACVDISFALPRGGALATCGSNLSGGVSPPAGQCTPTSGFGSPVKGFRIGSPATQYYDDGFDPVGVKFSPSQGFSCAIVASNVVQCVRNQGAWTSGAAALTYLDPFSFSRAGSLLSVSGGVGGAGYLPANGSVNVSTTGGGCSREPSISFTISAGVIQRATPYTPGAGCSSPPTVLFPAGGSGASAAAAAVGTFVSDVNLMGLGLYDNSGGFGGYEPGFPVTPVINPVQIQG